MISQGANYEFTASIPPLIAWSAILQAGLVTISPFASWYNVKFRP